MVLQARRVLLEPTFESIAKIANICQSEKLRSGRNPSMRHLEMLR